MEERNMRWGELIGGLLFVGGGIALAVSLREKLEAIPYSQFLLFATIAAAVLGMGLYAHHRWKLDTTSRGLLIIGTLLTPLSFLVMADLPREHGLPVTLAVEAAGLGLFGWLCWLAARVIVPEGPRLTALGVLGNSVALLMLGRLVQVGYSAGWVLAGGILPVGMAIGVLGVYLDRLKEPRRLDAARAGGLLTLLGVTMFAVVLAEGHLIARKPQEIGLGQMLGWLSPIVVLAALPLAGTGLFVRRRMLKEPGKGARHLLCEAPEGPFRQKVPGTFSTGLETYRVVGTTLALVGVSVMLGAVAMAWPAPWALLAVGLLDMVLFAWIAFGHRLPVAHGAVVASVALVCLTTYHAVAAGSFRQAIVLLDLVSARSGNVLAIVFVASAAAAEWLARQGLHRHARAYGMACAPLAVVGLSLVTWHGLAGGGDTLRAAILYGVYGLVSLASAARWRNVSLGYLGLALVQASLLWAFGWRDAPLRLGWLTFATATLVAVEIVHRLADRSIRKVYLAPLLHATIFSSVAALGFLILFRPDGLGMAAWNLAWIGLIWAALAWRLRSAPWFTACQIVFSLAALAAAGAWLATQPWAWSNPRSLQVLGVALALLNVFWMAARIATVGNRAVRRLALSGMPAVDEVQHHGLVIGQIGLLLVLLIPNLGNELLGLSWTKAAAVGLMGDAAGPWAWLLVGLLAARAIGALWHHWTLAEMIAGLLVALSAPCLIAARFAPEMACASALRWTLAGGLAVLSGIVCTRRPVATWIRQIGGRLDLPADAPVWARGVLLAGAVSPVVGLTLLAALLRFLDISPNGPAAGTFFEQIGQTGSYLAPLLLVIGSLVAFALRERSAGYAFGAGLVVEMGAVLGYLLQTNASGEVLAATVIQLATLVAAAWAVLWIALRPWTDAWSEKGSSRTGGVLMTLQLGMAALGNVVLILPALVTLALIAQWYDDWATAAASPLGWLALAATTGAIVYRRRGLGRAVQPELVGLVGMTVVGLAACTVQRFMPDWGFACLMLGWAGYAVVVAMATWWAATLWTALGAAGGKGASHLLCEAPEGPFRQKVTGTFSAVGPPQALVRAASAWVSASAGLAVLLGLKAACFHEERLLGATAVGLASVAGAMMAVWRRREGWALASALGVNLAASLAVWHFYSDLPFEQWWLLLIQANLIASAAVALIWLAAVDRLGRLGEVGLRGSPLLAFQTSLPLAAQAVLSALPLGSLIYHGERLPGWMASIAEPRGWFALTLVGVAVTWLGLRTSRANLPHVLGWFGMAAAGMAACLAVNRPDWLAYHVLLGGMTAVAVGLVALGIVGTKFGYGAFLPGGSVQGWATVAGVAAVLLAVIHAGSDPGSPWWPGSVLLALSVTAGAVALWRRRAGYVWISGLLLNGVATIAWYVWGPDEQIAPPIEANVVALGAGSILWSLVRLAWPTGVPSVRMGRRLAPFAHLASQTASFLCVILAAVRVIYSILEIAHPPAAGLAWAAMGATAGSIVVLLWDRAARLAVPGLYLACFTALGLGLDARGLQGSEVAWTGMLDLALFGLVAANLGLALRQMHPLWHALRIHDDRMHWPNWFSTSQTIVVLGAAALAVWVSASGRFAEYLYLGQVDWLAGQAAGVIAACIVLGAALLMVLQTTKENRLDWQVNSLILVAVALACPGFVWLVPADQAPWLHRSVVLMTATGLTAALAGGLFIFLPSPFGRGAGGEGGQNSSTAFQNTNPSNTSTRPHPAAAPQPSPNGRGMLDDLHTAARRVLPGLLGVTLVALVLVLGQEVYLRATTGDVPTMLWAELVVTGVLIGLTVEMILMAVVPGADPLRLSLNGRQLYVYTAEVIAALVGLHLWMAFPKLFALGIVEKYWMFLVMGVAFLGTGLSEWFHRRKMPVLSRPLINTALVLPLAPAVGFWWAPAGPASLWFLMGLFYGLLSVMRRSLWLAGLAVVAGNMGFWVLWHRMDVQFLDHPQLWLIPVALCALLAEYLHRDQLEEGQRTAVRYLALGTVYLSSSREIVPGVEDPVLPALVLIGLSVAGVLVGILVRIRPFLYLGVTFLTVAILRMILYAAFEKGQMWVFWTACVCLGASIIALFAVFEKRRAGR
ncbi:MAG: hypothetical protein JW818_08600 [Pirellulales bacterium]|nr:hypothetical protein [Pirellulales bacterium]